MKMSNKNKGEEKMKKILILLILTLIAITSCVDLSLNAGSYGTSVGVGLSSKDGNIRWNQNLDLSN